VGGLEGAGPAAPPVVGAPTDAEADLIAAVLAETEDTWGGIFRQGGSQYLPPTLVLFRQSVNSACGFATSAAGPFYCPSDRKVYLDLAFYDELATRFQAPGDFAQAYVLAHEVGHHVQNLAGTLGQVQSAKQRLSEGEQNQLQVRVELQADCYAGIWAHYADRSSGILEPGDIDEGLRAASAVGDDTIQRRMQGHVVPESFTHGSAEQRMSWFMRGFESGRLESCDTFAAR
jgi:predicted metalloprotease